MELPKLEPVDSASVRFFTDRDTVGFEVACKVFPSMAVFPFLEKKYWRTRFVSSFAEFVLHHESASMQFSFSFGKLADKLPLRDLASGFKLLDTLARLDEHTLHLQVILSNGESFSVTSTTTTPPLQLDGAQEEIGAAAIAAEVTAREFKLPADLQVDAAPLVDQLESLRLFNALFGDAYTRISGNTDTGELPPGRYGKAFYSNVVIGPYLVFVAGVVFGQPERLGEKHDNGRFVVKEPDVHFVEKWVNPLSSAEPIDEDQLLDRIYNWADAHDIVLDSRP